MLENFLGKDQARARALFRESDDAGDFMWMAEGGLRYYLPAALEHLQSNESTGGWFAHSLLCSLSVQAEWGLPRTFSSLSGGLPITSMPTAPSSISVPVRTSGY